MYSTCVFCNKPLGANESLEAFPVGRRIAFDAAKGRLWVVCRQCERWNLSPLEERWETIEEAERLYHDTRRRVATEHVGLARLRDGTDLVRIGAPLRPEFAAWRYGDQFGRRRKRQLLVAGAGVGAVGAVVIGGAVAGVGMGAFGFGIWKLAEGAIHGLGDTVVARVKTEDGTLLRVRRRHLAETRLMRGQDGPLAMDLRFAGGATHLDGAEAMRVASLIVPKVNRFGGAQRIVGQAVATIEEGGSAEAFLDRFSQVAHIRTEPARIRKGRSNWDNKIRKHGLFGLQPVERLALEMALHEDAEREALTGELEALEQAWRDAEQIAAISDDLLLPRSVIERIRRWRGM